MDTKTSEKTPELESTEAAGAKGNESRGDTPESNAKQTSESSGGENGGASDEELLAAHVEQASGLRDARKEGEEPRAGRNAVEVARDRGGRALSEAERTSALDWFLNEDPRAAADETQTVELNFGTQDDPQWVPWTIKPVAMETMRAVRRKAANTRAARQTGEVDEYRVNLEIVVEGTVDPDVKEAARLLHSEGRFPTADPVDAMRAKFASKPGYVAQLAGKIMTLSGFNDEDVRDAEKAAKN